MHIPYKYYKPINGLLSANLTKHNEIVTGIEMTSDDIQMTLENIQMVPEMLISNQ